jgi:hypothetical protein
MSPGVKREARGAGVGRVGAEREGQCARRRSDAVADADAVADTDSAAAAQAVAGRRRPR